MLIFLSSCDYIKVQAQLAALIGLDGTNSEISITSIASFAANTNTESAYQQFCKDLHQFGATEDMIREKQDQILEILRSQDMVASSRIGGSGDQDQDHDQDDQDDQDQDQALEIAYKGFCESMHQIGMTEDMILPKNQILEILRSRSVVAIG